jgi:hypothetical protein
VAAIAQSLPSLAWERISAGSGSKGELLSDWTLILGWEEDGWSRGLLVRRSIEEQPEHAYYLVLLAHMQSHSGNPCACGWTMLPDRR